MAWLSRVPAAAVAPPGEKLVGLEALRFTAAFAILVFHYPHFAIVAGTGKTNSAANEPFGALFAPFYVDGWKGVHLFWCISGFIFTWKYRRPIGAGAISFIRFAALRFSRLYPLHFATLLAVALLQMAYWWGHGEYFIYQCNDLKHFVLNLLFMSYWGFESGMSFNGPVWSVSLEVLVYALFFVVCRLVGTRVWLAVPLAMGLAYLSVKAHSYYLWNFNGFQAIAFFYFGVLTCHLYEAIIRCPRAVRMVSAGTALLIAVLSLTQAFDGGPYGDVLSPLLWPALIMLVQLAVPDHHPRANRTLSALGDMTYSSYLLHFPLQLTMVLLVGLSGARLADLVPTRGFFLVYIVMVLGLSHVVFRRFERPAQQALRRVMLARRAVVPTASAVSVVTS